MTSSSDRLDLIEALIQQSVVASNERMSRLEQNLAHSEALMEANRRESNERLTRIEQLVESNNRFLESFSADLRRYTDAMNNMTTRIDGVIATSNQDRQETNSRLAAIQRQVGAIAQHLGVT